MKNRWLQHVEVLTGLSVIVTLIVLIAEVRTNTQAIERQVLLDRMSSVAGPFTSGPELLQAYERNKELDGWEPGNVAFMERYGLEPAQAIAWTRFLLINWGGIEANFLTSGPSEELSRQIVGLMAFPDNRLFWETHAAVFDPAFETYVEEQISGEPTP